MKEKNSNKRTTDLDIERNAFEKIEYETKTTIFNVLYVLLKDDETAAWKYIVIALADYIQIWYFSFSINFKFPWYSSQVIDYLQTFLHFFKISYWFENLDFMTFLVFFYLAIFIVALVILDIFYVSYSFTRKKFTFVWPLNLFICTCMLNKNDGSVMRLFNEVQCWSGTHIIHSTFAIIASIIFISISLVISLTYYDTQSTTQDISARVNSRTEFFIVILKTVLSYVYMFIYGQQNHWLQIGMLLIFSIAAFYNYATSYPYYNDKMNRFFQVVTAIFLWANIIVLLIKILESTQFNGGLQIYFLGLPLIVGVIMMRSDNRVDLLMKNLNNFQRGEDYALQIRYFLTLIKNQDKDRKYATVLKGYIYQHEDQCPLDECKLKQYKSQISSYNQIKKSSKKSILLQNDNYQILLQHAQNMYRVGIAKFPDCTSLKIQYGLFLLEKMGKKNEALQELQHALNFDPPFDEQFIIYRYQKMSQDFGESFNDSGVGGQDIMSRYAYEQNFENLCEQIERSATLHLEFWNQLRDDRPDLQKLNEIGTKINRSLMHVEYHWNQCQKLNSNSPKALKVYAKFTIEILNDKEGGQELMSRAKEASNIKQNYFDQINALDDLNDGSQMALNVTPCIYVSGENHKIGMMTQCNANAQRIFGYTQNEMRNHNVEKLMPEMYAKYHSKILENALAKGPDNIPNKERLVFARHKSGYIFPVWLQLKMVQGVQNGVTFVAFFKIDKKIMNTNIAFILLNKDKKIQGISSSCMKLLNLDLPKMKRLHHSGIGIDRIAPSILYEDFSHNQKQGKTIEWYLVDYDKNKKDDQGNSTSMKKLCILPQPLQLNCQKHPIIMGEFKEIGCYLKLEFIENKKMKSRNLNRDTQKLPMFQFRFDEHGGKFIREIRENNQNDISASKNIDYMKGIWNQAAQNITPGQANNQQERNEDEDDDQNENEHQEKQEISKADDYYANDNIMERRKQWGLNIMTYRLVSGVFQDQNYEEELRRLQEIEMIQKRKQEEEEKQGLDSENLKNNIKSRKALQNAINDKTVPSAIKNLKITMNIMVLALIALSISEFILVNKQFTEINQNFNLIEASYGRVSEFQRIAYDIRTIIFVQEGDLTNFDIYANVEDFIQYFKDDMDEALNRLYELQSYISLSNVERSEANNKLINERTIDLHFRQLEGDMTILKFSLPESVLQLSSAVFTVIHLDLDEFYEYQEDIYFITYNVFNDFIIALRQTSISYVEQLLSITSEKTDAILTLFISAICVLFFALIILMPVVSSVNRARLKVLALFIDIPVFHVATLSDRCERFLASFQEDNNEELETDDGQQQGDVNNELNLQSTFGKRSSHRQPKNSSKSNSIFFIQFSIAIIVILTYFIVMYFIGRNYINNLSAITKEMNVLAQAESFYSFALNSQREMIYNKNKPLLNQDSFTIASHTLQQFYILNEQILDHHYSNSDILSDEYKKTFNDIYKGNICNLGIVDKEVLPVPCDEYIEATATKGLQSVMIRYFENLRYLINYYALDQEYGEDSRKYVDQTILASPHVVQFDFMQVCFRTLVDLLTESVNSSYQSQIDTRMAIFIVFVIGLIVSYLALWTPFVTKLNNEIWRTKAMLTIIPIEVILKIPRLQEFLNNSSLHKKLQT